jgi:acetoacetyl-CoA synthetase
VSGIRRSRLWTDFIAGHAGAALQCLRLPFDHPAFILYSSGTTGLPKCIVHGAGGTLLQIMKEQVLHVDIRPADRLFYATTCGWMMWNWLVNGLATGATIVLYEGAPLPPARPAVLWDMAAAEGITAFGTSAKYLALAEKAGLAPARSHDLGSLRAVLSTGSPLAPHSFDYVQRDVGANLQLSSCSGGTDIVSCFVLGNPLTPVRRGEIQGRGLGMSVEVFDEGGAPVLGEPGELVCTRPFPSMPIAFWNDPTGLAYRAAYFERFAGSWRQGDWAELNPAGGVIIYGRSDTTLNPGGVRIGTAEIYRQVEQLPEVIECIAVGYDATARRQGEGEEGGNAGGSARRNMGEVEIALFVRLAEGLTLDEALSARIRDVIRRNASPHHVPRRIRQVNDIPRTISGKIAEMAVGDALHGRPVANSGALANPGALDEYRTVGAMLHW